MPTAAQCAAILTPRGLPWDPWPRPRLWGRPLEAWTRVSQTFLDAQPWEHADCDSEGLGRGEGGLVLMLCTLSLRVWKVWQEMTHLGNKWGTHMLYIQQASSCSQEHTCSLGLEPSKQGLQVM